MKVIGILIWLFFGQSAFAQKKDSILRDSSGKLRTFQPSKTNNHNERPFVIDGQIYYSKHKKDKDFYNINDIKISETSKPLILMDEIPYDSDVKKLDSNKIFRINIIKRREAVKSYGASAKNGAILIITKQNAIKSYQEKLSLFSKDYKNFVAGVMKYNDNDDQIEYLIRGNQRTNFLRGRYKIGVLYDTPVSLIKEVKFSKNEKCCGAENVQVVITLIE